MNNKTISEVDFHIIWRILEIFLDLHNSLDDTQPHSIIVNDYFMHIIFQHCSSPLLLTQ